MTSQYKRLFDGNGTSSSCSPQNGGVVGANMFVAMIFFVNTSHNILHLGSSHRGPESCRRHSTFRGAIMHKGIHEWETLIIFNQ